MNIPLKGGLMRTPHDAALYAERVATSVAAGWNIEHLPDGRHSFSWTAIPYSSSLYTGTGTMTWTVTSAQQEMAHYTLRGKTMRLQLEVQNSTVGGVMGAFLLYRLPNGLVAARRHGGPFALADNGTALCGWWAITPGGTQLRFYRDPQAVTTYTASAGNTTVIADMEFEVQ